MPTMPAAVLTYLLAGISIVSAFIVTILNGLFYATGLSSHTLTTNLAPVGLSAVSCVALAMLCLLFPKHIRADQQCPDWKVGVFYFTGAYLLIAAGAEAGTMATSHTPFKNPLFVARFVVWEISVFTQGLYIGNLLVALTQKKPDPEWPRSYHFPESSSSVSSLARAASDHYRFEPKTSSLRRNPRPLPNQLRLQSTKESKPVSLYTISSRSSSPEPSPTNDKMPGSDRDTRPLLRAPHSIRSMPNLRHDHQEMPSLDSLVQYPSPAASMVNVSETRTREDHIHPLFRPSSPSPLPTPTAGTIVKASPAAGHTISVKTVSRMRSARSLREQAMRTPSPLPASTESDVSRPDAVYGMRSFTPYELHESPDEK